MDRYVCGRRCWVARVSLFLAELIRCTTETAMILYMLVLAQHNVRGESNLSNTLMHFHQHRELAAFLHLPADNRALDSSTLAKYFFLRQGELELERADECEKQGLHLDQGETEANARARTTFLA